MYPEITQLLPWKTNLTRPIVIAANNPDVNAVVSWLQEAWASGQTYQALGKNVESFSFVTLDMKLAQAMVQMMNRAGEKANRYRDKINLKTEESTCLGMD